MDSDKGFFCLGFGKCSSKGMGIVPPTGESPDVGLRGLGPVRIVSGHWSWDSAVRLEEMKAPLSHPEALPPFGREGARLCVCVASRVSSEKGFLVLGSWIYRDLS